MLFQKPNISMVILLQTTCGLSERDRWWITYRTKWVKSRKRGMSGGWSAGSVCSFSFCTSREDQGASNWRSRPNESLKKNFPVASTSVCLYVLSRALNGRKEKNLWGLGIEGWRRFQTCSQCLPSHKNATEGMWCEVSLLAAPPHVRPEHIHIMHYIHWLIRMANFISHWFPVISRRGC